MSAEGWIASVTGVIIAIGTVILVVYTPFGRAAWRAGGSLVTFLRLRQEPLWHRSGSWLHAHRTRVIEALILLAVWSLASLPLFRLLAAPPLWSWIAVAVASVASVFAVVLAYRSKPAIQAVASPTAVPVTNSPTAWPYEGLDSDSARRLDLLRQAYGLAAAMLKYIPDSADGLVPWGDVRQFNELIHRLDLEGVDLETFAIDASWAFEIDGVGTSERFVNSPRVARQLAGLVAYARDVGLGGR
jgi:hypothetical protein